MTFPEWTKPGILGAVAGAIVIAILGFNWGGWTTDGSAKRMAQKMTAYEVTQQCCLFV